jgi:hypothetical protein
VHVICDNASPHKTTATGRSLVAHPRFQLHLTRPTAPDDPTPAINLAAEATVATRLPGLLQEQVANR